MTNEYDDIINLPHHVSKTHPQMSMMNRAAQFAPFAALAGHQAALDETARTTEDEIELEEDDLILLDRRISLLRSMSDTPPTVTITFFEPDSRKQGGSYHSVTGVIKAIDDYKHQIIMVDGKPIPIIYIIGIESDVFEPFID